MAVAGEGIETRETAGITIRLIIEEVRRGFGDAGVALLLELAGETRPVEVFESIRTWHSFDTRTRLFGAGAELTGDPDFARNVGRSILASGSSALLRSLMVRFGSPSALLRAVPIAASKFDTACETRLARIEPGFALVELRTKAAYEPSPHDCRYSMGLLSQAPALFGLPPAAVTQPQCQVEGAPHCTFEVRWNEHRAGRGRWRRRQRAGFSAAELVQLQLTNLQDAVAELIGIRDIDQVIAKVVEHAGSAVAAQQLLLAVRLEDGAPLLVRADGLDDEPARALAEAMIHGGAPPAHSASGNARRVALVTDVRSADRNYGKLIAFSSAAFMDGEQELLDAYGRLAATTLDATVALRVAADRRREAEVLGRFAARLIRVQDTVAIAEATVDATVEVLLTDRSILFRHVEESGSIVAWAQRGYEGELSEWVVTAEDTPELARVLREPTEGCVLDRSFPDPFLRGLMEEAGVDWFAAVPVRSSERLFGVLTAAGRPGTRPADREVVRRLAVIADQAAGAWEKALLLEQVNAQASLDALTGLANRRVFTEMLARLLATPGGPPLAVLFCDVDRFKAVNDALGHAGGDDLLAVTGRRLQRCVRSDDLVARLGGDEFTILLTGVSEEWSPEVFAATVHQAMSEPIESEGASIVVHLSIGATVAEPGTATVKDVLQRADAAMYVSKARGGDRLLMFEERMLVERSERIELEASLADALRDLEQFFVLYQPQVELATGHVVGVEALVRWRHPRRGEMAPGAFLALAEETGNVAQLDLHVLRVALAELAAWRAAGTELRVAVNFSARTLTTPGLAEEVEGALSTAGVPGSLLEIELTESTAVAEPHVLRGIIDSLHDLGVSVAVDDVGTGYSSLALLHQLPAQRIKIDRSFVQRLPHDAASRSVVEAVLLLADRLGQTAVAEGVETVEQMSALMTLGCEFAQGYLFARAAPAEEIVPMALRGLRRSTAVT